MVKSVESWLRKYEERATVATEDYKRGVANPKRPPATAAIQARKAIEAKMRSKETWDKWESNLRQVGDDGVIRAALEKGADRYAPGVRAGLPKVQQFAQQFSTHLEAGQKKVLAMPKITLDDGIKRAEAMIRHNAGFRFKK